MTAALIPNGKQQFIDINGAPLVAGEVYFYEPLTLIPKDTWQDADQGSLNTNPVVLDSRGQATIYGVGAYRQILKDADGNTIWDKEIAGFQTSVFGAQDTIASSTTTDLGSASSNNIQITGTNTINSFGTSATLQNPVFLIKFTGALTLTYNATSMVLPGAADITTAAGDSALVEVTDPTNGYWRMIVYWSYALSGALGTAALEDIGTSGATVPLLNGNNTWSGEQLFTTKCYSTPIVLGVVAGAITPDLANGNNFETTTSANLTINNPANVNGGQSGVISVLQSNAGLTLTWDTFYFSPGGISNVNLSGVNGARDYFAYYTQSTTEIIISPLLNPT